MPYPELAEYVASRTDTLIARWRSAARADEQQACQRLNLSDAELDDHFPELLDALVRVLRNHETESVEREGTEHGHHRRELGYNVAETLRELTLFRQMALTVVEEFEAETGKLTQEELAEARKRVLDVLDDSVKASVQQYVREPEQERDRVVKRLRESNEAKDRFLAMLSHELRNPLAPILSAARTLRRALLADPPLERASEIIERQARYQARLLDDLLEVNRIAHGKIELKLEDVPFQAAVRHAIESSHPAIEAKSLRLEVNIPEDILVVHGDATRLAQIVTNILTNAVKFTPDTGSIRLTTGEEQGQVVMRVQDTGIGISAEMLPHVFDLFAQAETSLDRRTGGIGVGLTLAKSLTEMHGGQIEGYSEGLGKGATFTLRLPLLRTEPKHKVAHLGFAKRVAIVEDNEDARQALTDVLQSMGLTVLPAADGQEALRLAAEETPDVFVVDIGLPGMSGYELARILRELPETRNRLLIALTGYGTAEDRKRAAEAGFDHHVTKPADVDQLYRLVTKT
jgi:signal transduction histidine kinase